MLSLDQVLQILDGGHVLDTDGTPVGRASQVFLDDDTGHPTWVTVETGGPGSGERFIPLTAATTIGHDVVVPFERSVIDGAPGVGDSGHLAEGEEARLLGHYGLYGSGYDDADIACVRPQARTERLATGELRLRDHVVTETLTETVHTDHPGRR